MYQSFLSSFTYEFMRDRRVKWGGQTSLYNLHYFGNMFSVYFIAYACLQYLLWTVIHLYKFKVKSLLLLFLCFLIFGFIIMVRVEKIYYVVSSSIVDYLFQLHLLSNNSIVLCVIHENINNFVFFLFISVLANNQMVKSKNKKFCIYLLYKMKEKFPFEYCALLFIFSFPFGWTLWFLFTYVTIARSY